MEQTTTNQIKKKKGKHSKPYYCRVQVNGRRTYKHFENYEDAENYLSTCKSQQTKHFKKGKTEQHSLYSLYQTWRKNKARMIKASTLSNYDYHFNFLSSLYQTWFQDITKQDVEELINKEATPHQWKIKICLQILNQLNLFCADLSQKGLSWSPSNWSKEIKPKKGKNKKPREFHTKEEIIQIIDCLSDPKKYGLTIKNSQWCLNFYLLGVNTGARIGELASMKKKNCLIQEKKILIDSTLTSVRGSNGTFQYVDGGSTKSGNNRFISMNNKVLEAVQFFLSENNEEGFLIPSIPGTKRSNIMSKIRNTLKRVCKALGIPYIGTHGTFRKTFATQIAQISKKSFTDMIASIQKYIGHSSPQMTMYYIQAMEQTLDDELEVLSRIT